MQNNVNSNISWYEGHTITSLGKILKFSKFYVQKYMASSEVMTSSTHSFAYSYRLVKKCFVKICETSKCHNFLIFQPIFIRFSLLCLKMFTLSSEIKLNLLSSSSWKKKSSRNINSSLLSIKASTFYTTMISIGEKLTLDSIVIPASHDYKHFCTVYIAVIQSWPKHPSFLFIYV